MWTEEEEKVLEDLYNKGIKLKEIGIKMKKSRGSISWKCHELKLKNREYVLIQKPSEAPVTLPHLSFLDPVENNVYAIYQLTNPNSG